LLTFKNSALTFVCDSIRMYTEQRVESSNSLDFCSLLLGRFAMSVLLAMSRPNTIDPLNSCLKCVNNTSLADFEIIGFFFRMLISTRHYPANTVKQYGIEFPFQAEMLWLATPSEIHIYIFSELSIEPYIMSTTSTRYRNVKNRFAV